MIRIYIRVELSSEGESPKQVIERMRRIGAVPVVGDYDFELALGDEERLFDRLEEIHHALRGSNVRYVVTTRTDLEEDERGRGKRQVTHVVDQKPVELKKRLYKAKLERWKEMGLDVSELEPLLEKNLDHFKEASKDFLRTHLDRLSVIKDKHPPEVQLDGQILGLVDEKGKSLEELMSATSFSEVQVTLSLGRLISAGSVRRVQNEGSGEVYCLIPPPAPPRQPTRKALQLTPAADEAEAEERVLTALAGEAMTESELLRVARLPKGQLEKSLKSLVQKGALRKVRRGKRVAYRRT